MILDEQKTGIELKFYELCKSVITHEKLALYDLEFIKSSNTLRIFILNETTNTASLDECVLIDRALGPSIENNDWIPESLVLEVSSPGLFRKLKTMNHFERAKGAMVEFCLGKEVKLESKSGCKSKNNKKIRALVKEVRENDIEIELAGENIKIDFDDIKKANLSPDINF